MHTEYLSTVKLHTGPSVKGTTRRVQIFEGRQLISKENKQVTTYINPSVDEALMLAVSASVADSLQSHHFGGCSRVEREACASYYYLNRQVFTSVDFRGDDRDRGEVSDNQTQDH